MSSANNNMTAKENANPQLFRVEKERAHARRGAALAWSDLGDFNQMYTSSSSSSPFLSEENASSSFQLSSSSSSIDSIVVPTTAQDKAILLALMQCSMASKDGRGVALLSTAGLSIPSPAMSPKHRAASNPVLFRVVPSSYDNDRDTSRVPRMEKDGKRKLAVEDNITRQSESSTTACKSNNAGSPIDAEEIFDIIRNIQDPEHPHSLEQLGVVSREQVEIQFLDDDDVVGRNDPALAVIEVRFTPTIPHCSMATLIGLCIKVKLLRSLGTQTSKYKVNVQIEPGTHASEKAINKQLRDKERVCAALENKHLVGVVNKCIKSGEY